jgi:cellulose biosynthesis protein BcsQ
MLITVTAPKKGLGQTTTAINIAAMIAKYFKIDNKEEKVILLDINKYCKDIEYYLSDTSATRGLDDFYSLYKSKYLVKNLFKPV